MKFTVSNNRFIKQSFILLFLQVSTLLLTLSFQLQVAKELPASEYGFLSLLLSILIIAVTIAKLGTEQGVIRFVAKSEDDQ